jgi:hypothetical protein
MRKPRLPDAIPGFRRFPPDDLDWCIWCLQAPPGFIHAPLDRVRKASPSAVEDDAQPHRRGDHWKQRQRGEGEESKSTVHDRPGFEA